MHRFITIRRAVFSWLLVGWEFLLNRTNELACTFHNMNLLAGRSIANHAPSVTISWSREQSGLMIPGKGLILNGVEVPRE